MNTGPGCWCQPEEAPGWKSWVCTTMSIAGFACAMYSNGACPGGTLILNLSYVPRPINVGVTPVAGEAHVSMVYPAAINKHRIAKVHFAAFVLINFIAFSWPLLGVTAIQRPNPAFFGTRAQCKLAEIHLKSG